MEQTIRFDGNFQRLERKHRELSERLEALQQKRYLSDAEKLEEVRIKKMKLALKDQMESLARSASR